MGFGFVLWWPESFGLKSLLVGSIVMGEGRERETLEFLPWTSSRKWCGEEKGKVGNTKMVEGRLLEGSGFPSPDSHWREK